MFQNFFPVPDSGQPSKSLPGSAQPRPAPFRVLGLPSTTSGSPKFSKLVGVPGMEIRVRGGPPGGGGVRRRRSAQAAPWPAAAPARPQPPPICARPTHRNTHKRVYMCEKRSKTGPLCFRARIEHARRSTAHDSPGGGQVARSLAGWAPLPAGGCCTGVQPEQQHRPYPNPWGGFLRGGTGVFS